MTLVVTTFFIDENWNVECWLDENDAIKCILIKLHKNETWWSDTNSVFFRLRNCCKYNQGYKIWSLMYNNNDIMCNKKIYTISVFTKSNFRIWLYYTQQGTLDNLPNDNFSLWILIWINNYSISNWYSKESVIYVLLGWY